MACQSWTIYSTGKDVLIKLYQVLGESFALFKIVYDIYPLCFFPKCTILEFIICFSYKCNDETVVLINISLIQTAICLNFV